MEPRTESKSALETHKDKIKALKKQLGQAMAAHSGKKKIDQVDQADLDKLYELKCIPSKKSSDKELSTEEMVLEIQKEIIDLEEKLEKLERDATTTAAKIAKEKRKAPTADEDKILKEIATALSKIPTEAKKIEENIGTIHKTYNGLAEKLSRYRSELIQLKRQFIQSQDQIFQENTQRLNKLKPKFVKMHSQIEKIKEQKNPIFERLYSEENIALCLYDIKEFSRFVSAIKQKTETYEAEKKKAITEFKRSSSQSDFNQNHATKNYNEQEHTFLKLFLSPKQSLETFFSKVLGIFETIEMFLKQYIDDIEFFEREQTIFRFDFFIAKGKPQHLIKAKEEKLKEKRETINNEIMRVEHILPILEKEFKKFKKEFKSLFEEEKKLTKQRLEQEEKDAALQEKSLEQHPIEGEQKDNQDQQLKAQLELERKEQAEKKARDKEIEEMQRRIAAEAKAERDAQIREIKKLLSNAFTEYKITEPFSEIDGISEIFSPFENRHSDKKMRFVLQKMKEIARWRAPILAKSYSLPVLDEKESKTPLLPDLSKVESMTDKFTIILRLALAYSNLYEKEVNYQDIIKHLSTLLNKLKITQDTSNQRKCIYNLILSAARPAGLFQRNEIKSPGTPREEKRAGTPREDTLVEHLKQIKSNAYLQLKNENEEARQTAEKFLAALSHVNLDENPATVIANFDFGLNETLSENELLQAQKEMSYLKSLNFIGQQIDAQIPDLFILEIRPLDILLKEIFALTKQTHAPKDALTKIREEIFEYPYFSENLPEKIEEQHVLAVSYAPIQICYAILHVLQNLETSEDLHLDFQKLFSHINNPTPIKRLSVDEA